jgi:hypothetical protein
MHERTRSILAAADHPTACEYPPGFACDLEMVRARKLAHSLEGLLGEQIEVDDRVEDASFFVQLTLVDLGARPERGALANARLAIRLSAFGNLCTTHSVCSPSAELPPELLAKVKGRLADAGYIYVDDSELEEPYDGANLHLRKEDVTWAIRFFDYL